MKKTMAAGGLYTGLPLAVTSACIFHILQTRCFDILKGLNPYRSNQGFLGAASTFVAAQTAVVIGILASHPFDTVRRRLQMQAEKPVEEHLYSGAVDCVKKIASEEGLATGLYKGVLANVAHGVIGALFWIFFAKATRPFTISK